MRFLLLIRDGGIVREWSEVRETEAYGRMMRWADDLRTRGIILASAPLCPESEGARVTARDGKPVTIDGPFAETKDVVGGFTLIDCASKTEAIAIASACPATEWGCVEVRELRVGPALRR